MYTYDPRVGRIIVTIHPDDLPEAGDASSLEITPPAPNAEVTLQEGILVPTGNCYHRFKAIF